MAYTPHRWLALDANDELVDTAECITCGMSEDDAAPWDGPLVPCITVLVPAP